MIDGPAAAAGFAEALMAQPRQAFGRNAIGSAITFAQLLIESNDINGFRRVIDVSGDSANSWNGVPLEAARQQAIAAALVRSTERCERKGRVRTCRAAWRRTK